RTAPTPRAALAARSDVPAAARRSAGEAHPVAWTAHCTPGLEPEPVPILRRDDRQTAYPPVARPRRLRAQDHRPPAALLAAVPAGCGLYFPRGRVHRRLPTPL